MSVDARLNKGNWRITFGEGKEGEYDHRPQRIETAPGDAVSTAPFTREDVAEVIHHWEDDPEQDAECLGDWTGAMVGRLKDGRYVACSGWHDYSGWG